MRKVYIHIIISISSSMLSYPLYWKQWILVHFQNGVMAKYPINCSQYAYQSNHPLQLTSASLVGRIEDLISLNKIIMGVFLDIQDAFNITTYSSIIYVAQLKSLDIISSRWLGTMFSSYPVWWETECTCSKRYSTRSILSPVLWNMIVD